MKGSHRISILYGAWGWPAESCVGSPGFPAILLALVSSLSLGRWITERAWKASHDGLETSRVEWKGSTKLCCPDNWYNHDTSVLTAAGRAKMPCPALQSKYLALAKCRRQEEFSASLTAHEPFTLNRAIILAIRCVLQACHVLVASSLHQEPSRHPH